MYNHARPTVWSDDANLRLDAYCCGTEAEIVLSLVPERGCAALSVNGEPKLTLDYQPAAQHGLYLTLREMEVRIRNIRVSEMRK